MISPTGGKPECEHPTRAAPQCEELVAFTGVARMRPAASRRFVCTPDLKSGSTRLKSESGGCAREAAPGPQQVGRPGAREWLLVDLDAGKRSPPASKRAHLPPRSPARLRRENLRAARGTGLASRSGRRSHHAHGELLATDAVGIAQDLERGRNAREPLRTGASSASMLIATTRMPVRAASCW